MYKITILGTGAALVKRCYNTCFTLSCGREHFLVDGGGGNGILKQLDAASIDLSTIRNAFITHNHSDHLLGMLWVVRAISQAMNKGEYSGVFNIYGHKESLDAIRTISPIIFSGKVTANIDRLILLHKIEEGSKLKIGDFDFTFFNLKSRKQLQHGFSCVINESIKVAFHGDEPIHKDNYDICRNADYLIQEAYCLYSDADRFKPYEKSHATVLDACKTATLLNAKTTILIHTEDKTLQQRKELYTKEGATVFDGNIIVPDDLEVIELS